MKRHVCALNNVVPTEAKLCGRTGEEEGGRGGGRKHSTGVGVGRLSWGEERSGGESLGLGARLAKHGLEKKALSCPFSGNGMSFSSHPAFPLQTIQCPHQTSIKISVKWEQGSQASPIQSRSYCRFRENFPSDSLWPPQVPWTRQASVA